MRVYPAIDVSEMPRFGKMLHPLYLGIAFLVVIEGAVSAGLIASYFYLAAKADEWPPPGTAPPDLLWPSISVALLLASAMTMRWAGRGIDRGDQRVLTIGVGLSTLLASIVLVFRAFQFDRLTFGWNDHAYGSLVWTITGFHFAHVASAVLGTAVVTVVAMNGYFTQRRQLGVVVDTLYWYFVALVWVPFYAVLYWAPRLS